MGDYSGPLEAIVFLAKVGMVAIPVFAAAGLYGVYYVVSNWKIVPR
jgi:hypothetical protein